ncbi:hypothetical protein Aph01nite_15330 [Acrocarpospora phusangensis]|uniref:DUF3566 domain-containing protein n=1 Tax=Acrocarpospora phusangensis TaxID=1070424 RepID=A0A919UME6_9ACTN|nr:DUF3566 domain-containing protein [Acrocarpospora phusangensis]GIH23223.1 hypothetical protein Aph01nite_15330 [Acrocarpospora phusangensis]
MSNSGSASARTTKASAAKPTSFAMRDGVSERIDDEGPDSPRPAEEEPKTDDSTVRIRTTGPDPKPWSPAAPDLNETNPRPPAVPSVGTAADLTTPAPADRPILKTKPAEDKKSAIRAPRKAHLVLRRVEPWSAMKFSFVVSLVCFVVLFVAVAVLYGVLSAMGVFDEIVKAVNQLTVGEGATPSFNVASWFEPVRILGYTALLGAINVVLITALATLGAVIYNLSADLVGGVEVTFSEAE